MNGSIINFIDKACDDSTLIKFNRVLTYRETHEIKTAIKEYIEVLREKELYFEADDKLILKKVLNSKAEELNFEWEILQVSDCNVYF